MENNDLQITQIIQIIQKCKQILDITNNNKKKENKIDDDIIWKAYGWIEYSILIIRLKKFNLLDQPLSKELDNFSKPKKNKADEKVIIEQIGNLFSSINYKNEESFLESLRHIRNLLKIIVKNRQKIKNKKLAKKI